MGIFLPLKILNFVHIPHSCIWPKESKALCLEYFTFQTLTASHDIQEHRQLATGDLWVVLGEVLPRGMFTSERRQDCLLNASNKSLTNVSIVLISIPMHPAPNQLRHTKAEELLPLAQSQCSAHQEAMSRTQAPPPHCSNQ